MVRAVTTPIDLVKVGHLLEDDGTGIENLVDYVAYEAHFKDKRHVRKSIRSGRVSNRQLEKICEYFGVEEEVIAK